MTAADQFYLEQEEPLQSCLLALKEIILAQDSQISTAWKYGMPFFCFKGKMFAYLWIHKKLRQPYIGIVEGKKIAHPDLLTEKRSRMKILLLDPHKDLPLENINNILNMALSLYR